MQFCLKGADNMELAWTVFCVVFMGSLAIPLAGIVLLLIVAIPSAIASAIIAFYEKIVKRKTGK